MRLYSWLMLYTHCFLTFCAIVLYWNTRSMRKLATADHDFSALVSGSGASQPGSDAHRPQGRLRRWRESLLHSLRQQRESVPVLISDELSATVTHANIFGPPSSAWVDTLQVLGPERQFLKPSRVLVLNFIAPGTNTAIFWQALLSMQDCAAAQRGTAAAGFEMLVLIVVVGEMQKENAASSQQWTRELVQKAHHAHTTAGATAAPDPKKHPTNPSSIRTVSIVWMQGSLQNILREAMAMVEQSGVIDQVLWIHPGIRDFVRVCGLVSQFRHYATVPTMVPVAEDAGTPVSARCFDESQLRNYNRWVGSHTDAVTGDEGGGDDNNMLRDTANDGSARKGGAYPVGAYPVALTGYAPHQTCNILFPLRLWEPHMKMYSTLDAHGAVRWYSTQSAVAGAGFGGGFRHTQHHGSVLAPDTIFVMSMNVYS